MGRVVLGLGNPGTKYEGSRHNVGHELVAAWAGETAASSWRSETTCRWCPREGGVTAALTAVYMNESGQAAAWLVERFGVEAADLLVVHDELDLPLGRMKLKRGGGCAGHRGVESVADMVGTEEFSRLRVGVGRPAGGAIDVVDWVLSPFAGAEREVLDRVIQAGVGGIQSWIEDPFERALAQINGVRLEPSRSDC